MTLTRRQFFTATAIFAFFGVAGSVLTRFFGPARAESAEPDPAELAKPGPDGDIVLGSEKAPVTIVEYASMTCPHCAHFSTTTFPELEKRYIDTGKVRFIFREFPLDPLAAAIRGIIKARADQRVWNRAAASARRMNRRGYKRNSGATLIQILTLRRCA